MRWVLIRPLNQSLYYDPEIQEPLGIEYIGAVLHQLGSNVLILDSALNNLTDERIAKRTLSFEPDAIGFSITTDRELHSVQTIYNICKELGANKEYLWLAGGNFITSETENALKFLPPDFHLIKYEAEAAIKMLCNNWKLNSFNTLPRLIEGEATSNLDSLPFPLRPYTEYLLHYGWAFNLQGSRGCCSACRYCASQGMRTKNGLQWRGRSAESMVNEIEYLYNAYNARTFNFVDEDFLGPPSSALIRTQSFLAEIKKRQLKLTFGIQIRPNSLSVETIEGLVSAGLKYVFMGIESDNPDDFRNWGRSFCPDTWKWVKLLQEKDVEVNAGTLLFHPDSNLTGIRAFATKLNEHGLFNYRTAINRLDAMPGSYFHEQFCNVEAENYDSAGIFALPFRYPGMEQFYETVLKVLAPIEIPSMQGLCALPIAQTKRVFGNSEEEFQDLKSINRASDERVSKCFFELLNMFESGSYNDDSIEHMLNENRILSNSLANQLIEKGFVRAPETLLKAMSSNA
jgi:methylmalonyl-CoA mutase cobalamin-binding subunit